MNTNKMGHRHPSWYIIVLILIGSLLLTGTASPLLAGEIKTTPQRLRLADRTGLMYGLKGGSGHKQKVKRSVRHRPGQVHATQKKWTPAARQSAQKKRWQKATLASKPSRWSGKRHTAHQNRRLQPAVQGDHGKRVVARSKSPGARRTLAARKTATPARTLFAASVERRMGTFVEPVSGSASARSSGLFFRVPENADVLAASRGQVVYAGWFRGYGLLTILNHGGRVYSLYGHNRDLLVAKGDFVEPGQIIAKSGKTDSVDGVPGLYFEIRKGNKPENPRRWLVKERTDGEKLVSLAVR